MKMLNYSDTAKEAANCVVKASPSFRRQGVSKNYPNLQCHS